MIVVALHGAFRGGWYWEPLAQHLAPRGIEVLAPDLVGDHLADWTGIAERTIEAARGEVVSVVGHSLGGVVAQGLPSSVAHRIEHLLLLDAPLIDAGQRPVDVSTPEAVVEAQLPAAHEMVPPTPVGEVEGFADPVLASWVNERLMPVPMGPQLDPLPEGLGRPTGTRLVFFGLTPPYYPSALARRRCEAEGRPHDVLAGQHHDAPVLDPATIAALVAGSIRQD